MTFWAKSLIYPQEEINFYWGGTMRGVFIKAKIFIVFLLCLAFFFCNLSPLKKEANVVMLEGPIFENSAKIFYYKGRVQNKGGGKALWLKIYIYIRDSAGNLLAQEETYADDYELEPGKTSAWDVIFSYDEHSLRAAMDQTKTTYKIEWDEEK